MTDLREALITLLWILGVLFYVSFFVVGISAIVSPKGAVMSETEAGFRTACSKVNGSAVWNGRHWECLK